MLESDYADVDVLRNVCSRLYEYPKGEDSVQRFNLMFMHNLALYVMTIPQTIPKHFYVL